VSQQDFSATVNSWITETKERLLAVRNESAQRVIEVMQTPVASGGNLPVDTGFLRASLRATLGEPAFPVTENPGGSFSYDAGTVSLVIADAKITDTITAVYGANYAIFVNYGTSRTPARRFVDLAAQQWPRIVEEVAAEARARAKK
jgi:hypothetical protein